MSALMGPSGSGKTTLLGAHAVVSALSLVVTDFETCAWSVCCSGLQCKPGGMECSLTRDEPSHSTLQCVHFADVLAGRKTVGSIKGQILFSGVPPTQTFLRRFTGYVEQVRVSEDVLFCSFSLPGQGVVIGDVLPLSLLPII